MAKQHQGGDEREAGVCRLFSRFACIVSSWASAWCVRNFEGERLSGVDKRGEGEHGNS